MQDEYDYGHAGRQTSDTNPVGLAGFIVSLVSLVGCGGLLSPVGLILSLVGVFRQPRSFAIAGVVLGIIGSGMFVLVVAAIGVGVVAGVLAMVFGASFIGQTLETGFDANEVREAIVAHERSRGELPASLDDLSALDEEAVVDLWDTPYHLAIDPDARTMTLTSLGKDQTLGTGDDISVTLPIVAIDGDAPLLAPEGDADPTAGEPLGEG